MASYAADMVDLSELVGRSYDPLLCLGMAATNELTRAARSPEAVFTVGAA